MLYLKELNFFVSVLKQTKEYVQMGEAKTKASGQMGRLYNDALMGLFHLGIELDRAEQGLAYQIDGEVFPVPASMRKVMEKKLPKEFFLEISRQDGSQQAKSGPCSLLEDNKSSKLASEIIDTEKKDAKTAELSRMSGGAESTSEESSKPEESNSLHEPQAIVNRHIAKVVNKRNPSDVQDFIITVLPLGVKDNATATDIVVEIEHNGKFVYFVSEQKKKSIMAEIEGIPFNIRGQWTNRTFTSALYLGSSMKTTHNLNDKVKEIMPDVVSQEYYADDFVKEVGNSTLYILPFGRLNEPNGRCKVAVVQETDGDRQIYCDNEKNILLMYLDGLNFRVYGKWTADKCFKTTVERTD